MPGDTCINHDHASAAKVGTPDNPFVQVSIAPHSVLTRRGTNICVTLDVDFADAILGEKVAAFHLPGALMDGCCIACMMALQVYLAAE